MMQLHPGTEGRAVLLRGIQVLEATPVADLTGSKLLLLNGADNPFGRLAPTLEHVLRTGGADVERHTLPGGHDPGAADVEIAARWLAA